MLVFRDISKSFKIRGTDIQGGSSVVALDHVSIDIGDGCFFGLIGPNGAGKTTLINILTTMLLPDAGQVLLNEVDVIAHPVEARKRIGVVWSGERALYWKLSAEENLRYFARLYHLKRDEAEKRITEVLEQVGLSERRRDYVERFSTGMKRRLAIARAILHRPPVLILDEPTANIDPNGTDSIHRLLGEIHRTGTTILLATNDLHEAEKLCEDIAIINRGRLVARSSPDDLKARLADGQSYSIAFEDATVIAELSDYLQTADWCLGVVGDFDARMVTARVRPAAFSDLLHLIQEYGRQVIGVTRLEPTLEDVFRAYTTGAKG